METKTVSSPEVFDEQREIVQQFKPIDIAGVRKLLDKCDAILGHFRSDNASGYQLIFVIRVPVFANKKRIGERREWHRVTFGDLPGVDPDVYLHASYGDLSAIKILLDAELAKMKRMGTSKPTFEVRPAVWGFSSDSNLRPMTFSMPGATDSDGKAIPAFTNRPCWTMYIGAAYLTVAGFTFEGKESRTWGRNMTWNLNGDNHDSRDGLEGYYSYRFTRETVQ
jgi:hypothetical protein